MKTRFFSLLIAAIAAAPFAGACGDSNDDTPGASGAGGGAGALTVTQLDAGGAHTCALLSDGSVRCWGSNAAGELGYGNLDDVGDDELPARAGPVDLGAKALQLSAGAEHTCALLEGGAVRCWGAGAGGRLGYGNQSAIGDDEAPARATPVDLGAKALQVAAGGDHSCALLEGGVVRCWGAGAGGQLGYGNLDDVGDDEPPAQAGPVSLGAKALQIAAGPGGSCAVLEGGAVRCWGLGAGGRLGYGNVANVGDDEAPAQAGPVSLGAGAEQVAVANGRACARLADGSVHCWGAGAGGQLGYGNLNDVGDDELPAQAGPVSLGAKALQLDAGLAHTCALLEGGVVRCWGTSAAGALGHGKLDVVGDDEPPTQVAPVPLGAKALHVTCGAEHACALLEGGAVRCWGLGAGGRLGYGNVANIGDDEAPASVGFVSLF